jgi:hypothetical protein
MTQTLIKNAISSVGIVLKSLTKGIAMPKRTEERADDLAKFCKKMKQMAIKKGLDAYEFMDILIASICQTALRNNYPKEQVQGAFEKYWKGMKEIIEAESASNDG